MYNNIKIRKVVINRKIMDNQPLMEPQATRMGALEAFTQAAKDYGATGMNFEKHPDGTEVLSQKLGEGWHGLGYDGTNLWSGLTPSGERYDWNANTLLRQGETHRGITPGAQGKLDKDHPLAQLSKSLSAREGVEFHITGAHAGWQRDAITRLTPDEEGNLLGNIPVGTEIKAVITNVEAEWKDAGWKRDQVQRLTIKPPKKI